MYILKFEIHQIKKKKMFSESFIFTFILMYYNDIFSNVFLFIIVYKRLTFLIWYLKY